LKTTIINEQLPQLIKTSQGLQTQSKGVAGYFLQGHPIHKLQRFKVIQELSIGL
jgi:hypothetical protein